MATDKTPYLRTSERVTFRRCGYKWWWAWRQGLTPPFAANALWFGEGIHLALATWYQKGKRRGPHPAETFVSWVGDERRRIFTLPNPQVDEAEVVDAHELGVAMLTSYVDHYGKDPRFHFISTEQPFQIDVPYVNGKGLLVVYSGTFDGVYRDLEDDRIWLIEHKTAKTISTAHLPLDDQAGSYWAIATQVLRHQGLIKPNDELEGILYNFLRKAKPDARPQDATGAYLNKDGTVSKTQPAPLFHREAVIRDSIEQAVQLHRIQDEALVMQQTKRGTLPLIKNPTRDCSWDCPFLNMCQLHEAGQDWEEYAESMYVVQDPYKAHRPKSAAM